MNPEPPVTEEPAGGAAELFLAPPPRQRYPIDLRRALRELGRSWELLLTFAERDLRVRYKQTILGGFWAILQPFLLMVIFTVVFGRIARVGSEGVPYPIFAYAALVPWGFFSGAVSYGTQSLIQNGGIVRKVYLPREVLPLSSVLSSGLDFIASWLILLPMLFVYGFFPRLTWVAYPVLLFALSLFATAATLVAGAATVHFRDVRYVVPTVLQLVLYLTPVAYPLGRAMATLPSGVRSLYPYLNPFVPIVDGFRRVLIHGQWPDWPRLLSSGVVGVILLFVSYRWYKHIDPTMPDVI